MRSKKQPRRRRTRLSTAAAAAATAAAGLAVLALAPPTSTEGFSIPGRVNSLSVSKAVSRAYGEGGQRHVSSVLESSSSSSRSLRSAHPQLGGRYASGFAAEGGEGKGAGGGNGRRFCLPLGVAAAEAAASSSRSSGTGRRSVAVAGAAAGAAAGWGTAARQQRRAFEAGGGPGGETAGQRQRRGCHSGAASAAPAAAGSGGAAAGVAGAGAGAVAARRGAAALSTTALFGVSGDGGDGGNGGGGGLGNPPGSKVRVAGDTWKRIGDVPSLVVGVGFLVARHRRDLRATKERRHLVGTRAEGEEEAAAAGVARVGLAGVAATTAGGEESTGTARRSGGDKGSTRELRRKEADSSKRGGGGDGSGREGGEYELEEGEGGGEAVDEERWTEVEGEAAAQQRQEAYRRRENGETVETRRRAATTTTPTTPSTERRVSVPRTSSLSLDVSLDRSVMPEPVGPVVVWGTVLAAFLGVIAVAARVPLVLGAVGSTVTQTVEPAYKHSRLPAVVGDLRYKSRLCAGSLRAWASRRSEAWGRAFGPEEEPLPAEDWSVCTLLERNREGGGDVLRYRFGLQGSPNVILPLELGQELTLCGLDATNQVVHGNYVPLTPRKQRGYFDIVVKRGTGGELDDGLGSTRGDREFSRFLHKLPIGDEIAVKPGREGLVYGGPYSPITDLVLIATGLGVVPMIQMVKELLPSKDSSVSAASVIWLNEKTEDFALYGELEEAFFRNHRKLDVSCIVERDLFGHQLGANANVREAAPDFKIGTLAAVAGPEFFTRKVTDYLVYRGYPEEVIITL